MHDLNPPQKEASTTTSGATMVIAGAGCGKTKVIVSRITHLLKEQKTSARAIVALTFTNKAAKEMLDRIQKNTSIDSTQGKPFFGTFHSYCFNLLKKYNKDFNLDAFGILDSTDQQNIVKKILSTHNLSKEFAPKKVLSFISTKKNNINPQSEELFSQPQKQILEEIYITYEKEKQLSSNLDFDDLIIVVYKKFLSDKVFLKKIQSSIDHILIDEYQDTSKLQHDLIKLLTLDENNNLIIKSIFAVGDQDQGIYSWRGATPENVNFFLEDFKPVKLVKIEQNYRSNQQILTAANSVITNNKGRSEKKLWSEKTTPNCLLWATCKNEYQEASTIATSLKFYLTENPTATCAILYRNHYQSRIIEEALIQAKIHYKIIGGIKFYERREIKDLISYLKLNYNPLDWISLQRVINIPTRGLGEKFLEKMDSIITEEREKNKPYDFKTILNKLLILASQEKTKKSITAFLELYENKSENNRPSEELKKILEKTNYLDFIQKEYEPKEAQEKIENIEELERSIKNFEYNFIGTPTIKDFLEEIALIQEADTNLEKTDYPTVQMMTLHGAKGLEFDKVAIIGLEENILPSIKKDQYIEEERRLFYVGITRAKEKLLLTSSETRNEYGKINSQSPSRFLSEIPKNILTEISGTSSSQLTNNLKLWCQNKPFNKTPAPTTQFFSKFTPNFKKTTPLDTSCNFKVNQIVSHAIFGTGIIKNIFLDSGTVLLEIAFKNNLKKINSSFVKKL